MWERGGLRLTPAMALVAVLLVPSIARANVEPRATMGGDQPISGVKGVKDERLPAVAYNAANRMFLVVREDERNTQWLGIDIFGRLVNDDGKPQGADFRVSGGVSNTNERHPAVAWNQADNQFLVVWADDREETKYGVKIWGRLLAGDGTPLGPNFRIGSGVSNQSYPAVAWNKKLNQYLVVWQDHRNFAQHGADIYGRRLMADGTRLGTADTRISEHEPGVDQKNHEYTPDVAWSSVSWSYLVVWADIESGSGSGWDIHGRMVRGNGTFPGEEFRICGAEATADDVWPAVAFNAKENRFLVVWMDMRRAATRGLDIYAQQVTGNGAPIDNEIRVSANNATGDEAVPDVAWNATNNRYLVVWDDNRNSGAGRGTDTFGQYLARVGGKIGDNFRVSGPGAVKEEVDPAIAWGKGKNRFLVVRGDARDYKSRGYDIYGRWVDG
ncbi:MAG: hypothetical protein FJW79_04955 [Actinobacteria bacterium]|nr:hypothetical protein [Actinomycetota bacterium]